MAVAEAEAQAAMVAVAPMVVEVIAVMAMVTVAVVAAPVLTAAVMTAAVVRLITAARGSIDAAPGPGATGMLTRHLEGVIAQARPAGRAQVGW